ncbi:MAG: serine hydrolase [Idiomarina sp.]|nr:serine hydrolase [Idiomarina sp.]
MIFTPQKLPILALGVTLATVFGSGVANASTDKTDATLDAYAAGYISNFVCSATFNGGDKLASGASGFSANKSMEQIVEHELTGIYDLVEGRIHQLLDNGAVTIDENAHSVSVAYATDSVQMPPRVSVWRPLLGCVDLPVGAPASAAEYVAGLQGALATTQHPAEDSGEPWQVHSKLNAPSGNDELDQVVSRAFSNAYGGGARTTAVLIATPDEVISEHYMDGFTPTTAQRTWSVAKSIGTSVIGAAVKQGMLSVDEPAALQDWSHPADPRQRITIEQLLHMSSGLDSNRAGNRTDRVYIGGGTVKDEAIGNALEVEPGSRFKYANNDTMLALRAVRERFASVEDYLAFPFTALLHKIGMQHTYLESDWQGDYILSSQVWTTSRDLARLGILHLQQGRWDDEQLLPEDWLAYISTPAPAQPPMPDENEAGTPGYGAQWWLFNERVEGIPDDTIAARGNRGQFLVIVPDKNLVIVRRGYDIAGEQGFDEMQFTRDVLSALE